MELTLTPPPAQAPASTPRLVERDAAVLRLHRLVDQAMTGSGATAVVEAGRGCGRSALLDVAADLARVGGMSVVSARACEAERDFPFCLARRLFPQLPFDEPAADHLRARVGELLGCLAEQGPVALVVDDAHLADPESLGLLEHLAARIGTLPVALIVATDQAGAAEQGSALRRVVSANGHQHIVLAPLSPAGAERLAHDLAPGVRRHPALLKAAYTETAGNPYLLGVLLSELETQRREVDDSASLPVPDVARRWTAAWTARVSPEAFVVAEAYAVLGADADLDRAADVTGLDLGSTAQHLDELVASGLLVSGTGSAYSSPLVARAVLENCLPGRRAALHTAAARALYEHGAPEDSVLRHLEMGLPARAPWAVDLARSAAARAVDDGDPERAVSLLRLALRDGTATEDARAGLMLEFAEAEAACGQFEDAIRNVKQVSRWSVEPARQAESLFTLSQLLHRCGRQPEAVSAYQRSIELAGALRPDTAL